MSGGGRGLAPSGALLLALLMAIGFPLAITGPLSAVPYNPPLEAYVETDDMPMDLLAPAPDDSATPLAERVRVLSFAYDEITVPDGEGERDVGATIDAEFEIVEGYELVMPGLEDAFTVVIGTGPVSAEIVVREEAAADPEEDFPFIARLMAPALPVSLRLAPGFFTPVQPGTFEPYAEGAEPDVELTLTGAATFVVRVSWDGEMAVDFDTGGGGPPSFALSTPVMLAGSGIVLEVGEVTVDLSELASPPGIADPSWRGLKLDGFSIHWTGGLEMPSADVSADGGGNLSAPGDFSGVTFEDFFIGTGGFSGRMCGVGLSLELPDPGLFGLDFRVDDLCVGFERNSLDEAAITGTVTDFPFFEADVALTLALDLEGNFTIGLADPGGGGLIAWTVPNVLTFHLRSASFEHREGVFLVRVDGDLEPLFFGSMDGVGATDQSGAPLANMRIPVNGLTISSEGDVSVEGGWITLPEKRYIDFNAFQLTLSQIGFGKTESTTDKSWFGFTGGVKLVDGLDAEAEVKRLQFLWGGGEPVEVKLEGVAVAFHQPGVLRFEGAVDWFDTEGTEGAPGTKGFAGKMELSLIALNNMTLASRVVVGSATPQGGDPFKFFYLDLETQFPAGVPVFAGISLYGLSGLFAYNMSPNISAFTSPVEWFHEYRQADNVIAGAPPPWIVQHRALALGAGVIFGTQDEGFTVNAKVALTVAVPGPIVVLSGQANILKPRGQLSDSSEVPDFVALAVYDGVGQTFLVNIGMLYSLAGVIEVSGEAEAFFNLADPGDWHLYMGQREPEDRRITARVLSLLEASSYYMIEPDGLAFGAKMKYGDAWRFGPLRVRLEAWWAYDAAISWRPIQVWGQIDLGGGVELSAFGFGLGLSVGANLALETPRPFTIEGDFKVKLNLPWPLPDPKASIHLRWAREGEQRPLDEAVTAMTLHSRKRDWVLRPELVSLSSDGAPTAADADVALASLCSAGDSVPAAGSLDVDVSTTCHRPLVPLDSFVSVRFDRSMNDPSPPDGGIAFGNPYSTEKNKRHRDEVQDQIFQYDATGFALLHHPKDAATVTVDTEPAGLYASWTSIPGSTTLGTTVGEADNNLDVLSKNPFRYYENTTFLGYGDEQTEWTDWAGGIYGQSWCLDGFKNTGDGAWEEYHGTPPWDEPPPPGSLDCPIDLEWMNDEDFVLPPYSVFRFVMDGEVREPEPGPTYRNYRNAVYFHTEGPPLALDDYVDATVPEFPQRPHYRGYDVMVRFNENYMNKLYRELEDQFLQIQVLDESENPVKNPEGVTSVVVTDWAEAPDALLTRTEAAWLEVLEDLGALDPANAAKDDLVFGHVEDPLAVRPGQLHYIRVWLEDDRLANDSRLTDAAWLARHPVRYINEDRTRVVLYELDFTASRFEDLGALVATFDAAGGDYFPLTVDPGIDLGTLGATIAPLDRDFADGGAAVGNGDTDTIGLFLRHLLAPTVPDELSVEQFTGYADRTPGYDGDAETLSGAQRQAAREAWQSAAGVFEAADAFLELDLERQPLPTQVEVSVIERGGASIGYLVELPEAIDLSRVEIEAEAPGVGVYRPTVVPNASDTRLLIFRRGGGGDVLTLADGAHTLRFRLHRDLGPRNPVMIHADGAATETAELVLSVPSDLFEGGL